eukprot:4182560-Amphidinium_carterae.1
MESGLEEIHHMGVTSHSPVRDSTSQEVSEVLRSAIGTPSDPSGRLQDFEEEFIGLPLLMARY